MSAKYSVARNGVEIGEYSEFDLKREIIRGVVMPTDHCFCEYMDDWRVVQEHFVYDEAMRRKKIEWWLMAFCRLFFWASSSMTITAAFMDFKSGWMVLPWIFIALYFGIKIGRLPDPSIIKEAFVFSFLPYFLIYPITTGALGNIVNFAYAPSSKTFYTAFFGRYFLGAALIYTICLSASAIVRVNKLTEILERK